MQRLQLPAQCRMSALPGNPRTLLGLEAALANDADVLVVRLGGMDPLGREAAITLLANRMGRRAVIYVGWPYWHQWQLHLDSVPGIPCLPMQGPNVVAPLAYSD
jgi:hypothetical protein